MASISTDPSGARSIQFIGNDGKRRTIRLGKLSLKSANEVRGKVEYLASAAAASCVIDNQTATWLGEIGDVLHSRLAKVGLVAPRGKPEPEPEPTSEPLGPFLESYIAGKAHYKPNTAKTIDQARRLLVERFGDDKALDAINAADAEDWLDSMRQRFKPATIATHVKRARQMFAYAVKAKRIAENPFVGLKVPQQVDKSREEFIDHATIARVIEAAPDAQWRTIIALSRFGGLRCPSEVLALEWQWIDWERERFTVFAPKQEKLPSGGRRVVPLFPELRPFLEEAFDLAAEGEIYVINRYRAGNTNLRTQFERIIARSGVEQWGRVFHNLRSSRQTELTEVYPAHVVAAWLGNTERIATRHYLQTTEAHMKSAAESGAKALQNAVQYGAAHSRMGSQGSSEVLTDCEDMRELASQCNDVHYPRQESNSPQETLGKHESDAKALHNPVQFSADLQRVVRAWPKLSADDRAAVLAIVDAAKVE